LVASAITDNAGTAGDCEAATSNAKKFLAPATAASAGLTLKPALAESRDLAGLTLHLHSAAWQNCNHTW
jgi:hypothetical protein